ncbi:MAG: hypothetical protein AAB604_02555 [Patescibacteria group bacterium]
MIITRQDPASVKLQTGETVLMYNADAGALDLKIAGKHLNIDTPGEYEIEGVMISGAAESSRAAYTVRWDDMVIGLGVTKSNQTYDVLISPQDNPTIEARVVIPLTAKLKSDAEEMDKFTFKKKDLPPEGKSKTIWLTPH